MSRTIKDILALFPSTVKQDWKQHDNGNGWVKTSAYVEPSAYIEGIVYGKAWVSGDAQVSGDARVYGKAWVYGNAQVSGDARVYGNAQVSGNAWVSGDAWETSPLYIQGSKHCATNMKHGSIAIGCEVHTFDEWLKNYKIIGKAFGYSPKQIKEYKAIIDLFVKIGR
jgi:hypothetical protein